MGSIFKGCLKLFLVSAFVIAGIVAVILIVNQLNKLSNSPIVEYRFYGSASNAYIAYTDSRGNPEGGTVTLPHNVKCNKYSELYFAATAEVFPGVPGTVTIEVYIDGKIVAAATGSGKDRASVLGPVIANIVPPSSSTKTTASTPTTTSATTTTTRTTTPSITVPSSSPPSTTGGLILPSMPTLVTP